MLRGGRTGISTNACLRPALQTASSWWQNPIPLARNPEPRYDYESRSLRPWEENHVPARHRPTSNYPLNIASGSPM